MTQKRTRENLNRLPREVEATLPSWVKCTYPISAETLEEVRSTVLVWLANVSNYVQETNQHFPYDEQAHPEEFDDGDGAWVFFVETHLCTDSRADSRLNHGEVDFEWFARLRRKCFVSKSLNLNINRGRLWSAFIRQMILSDVNVPKIGESDLRDIVVGSVELKPYDHTYYKEASNQQRQDGCAEEARSLKNSNSILTPIYLRALARSRLRRISVLGGRRGRYGLIEGLGGRRRRVQARY